MDRKACLELVQEAVDSGATRAASCKILELSVRTLERWREAPEVADGRSGPLTPAPHSLTKEEKKMIIEISNSPVYQDLCPWKIVAKLADSGRYIASESSFYRVLKDADLLRHRSRSKPRERKRPKDLIARRPNCVWSWDITYRTPSRLKAARCSQERLSMFGIRKFPERRFLKQSTVFRYGKT